MLLSAQVLAHSAIVIVLYVWVVAVLNTPISDWQQQFAMVSISGIWIAFPVPL